MQDVITSLASQIPEALHRRGARDVTVPAWWDGPNIDHPRRVIQLRGDGQDVNSMESPLQASPNEEDLEFADRGWPLSAPAGIAGAWTSALDPEAGFRPPEGWHDHGVEALAWYSSFHYCPYAWGIFIRSSGVEAVGAALVANTDCSVDEAFRAAWTFLYEHELTHFRTDILIAGAEFASSQALFLPGRLRQSQNPHSGLAEEALATAMAVRALPKRLRTGLNPWLDQSPAGYRDWRQHTSSNRQTSWATVLGEVVQGAQLPLYWTPATGRPPHESDVPVFLIVDTAIAAEDFSLAFLGPIKQIEETSGFQRDMRRLQRGDPRIVRLWSKRKDQLAAGALGAGSHLELIDASRDQYTVRLDGNRRAALERDQCVGWRAVAAGQHDELYARLRRMG